MHYSRFTGWLPLSGDGGGWLVELSDSGNIQLEKIDGGGGGNAFNFITQGEGNNDVVGGTINQTAEDFNACAVGFILP